jgi:hypothetical protein
MATKQFDLAVKVGEYTTKDGDKKNRYQNVGVVMAGDDGRQFIMLARWFNPGGVGEPGKESVLISMFEPRERKKDDAPF